MHRIIYRRQAAACASELGEQRAENETRDDARPSGFGQGQLPAATGVWLPSRVLLTHAAHP
jgi:hypothetical protein